MPFVRTNGINMYYETTGSGLAVVLVAGLGADGHFWYKQVPALARHFLVITPDNRGAGQTDKPDESYTLRMMADDLLGLLDALEVPRVHLVGASAGGFIAQEYALASPQRVRNLVLCCTSFGGPRSEPIPAETLQILLNRTGDAANDLRNFLRVQFGTDYPSAHPQEIEDYVAWRVAHPQPLFAYHRQLVATTAHDTESHLPSVRVPVLILHGGRDRVVPARNAELLAEKIPGARLHVFPDAGHLFLWEEADAANRLIIDFLKGSRNANVMAGGGTARG